MSIVQQKHSNCILLQTLYLVKWLGWDREEDLTWEPLEHLQDPDGENFKLAFDLALRNLLHLVYYSHEMYLLQGTCQALEIFEKKEKEKERLAKEKAEREETAMATSTITTNTGDQNDDDDNNDDVDDNGEGPTSTGDDNDFLSQ